MIRTRNRELASLARQRGFLLNPARFAAGGGGGSSWHTTFSDAAVDNGGNQGFTEIRTVIPAAATHAGTGIRFTFRSGAGSVRITAAYIGFQAASGDAYDFASTPVQILFGGSNEYTTAGGGEDFNSDDVAFAPDGTTNLVFSHYVRSGFPGSKEFSAGWSSYYWGFGTAANAADVDANSGFSVYGRERSLISVIQVLY